MDKNISVINNIIKEEIDKLVNDGFDLENRDLEFVVVDESNYNDNIMIIGNYDRGGVYIDLWDKEEVDEEEYMEMKEDVYGDGLCIVEVENGVVIDKRKM
jgi:hypothetical protein